MRLGVVGGKLQGTEAAYLAGKAGYEVVLVDRRAETPASGLAHEVHEIDITVDEARARHVFSSCDAVLPACEDDETLEWLDEHVPSLDVPLLFDLDSYAVTSSKLRSNELFDQLGVARPIPWPACGFPLIVKPSSSSGSEGVRLVDDEDELEAALAALETDGHEAVVEEYAPGPSLSLEVIGWDGEVAVFQPTLLEFDRYYDCKRVVAPVDEVFRERSAEQAGVLAAFDEMGRTLASGLGLRGIMDIEVMLHGGALKVLEIDARLPSQTPTAVLHSCGVNLVEILVETALHGRIPVFDRVPAAASCYQHVRVAEGVAEVLGEHMMGAARPLRLIGGFRGADEAIVDRPEAGGRAAGGGSPDEWVATLITRAPTLEGARLKAVEAVMALASAEGLTVRPESTAMPGDECR